MATISDEEHRTSTVVDDLWPPTNVTEAPAEDCDDPEQACYYAHLLRVVNVLDLYLLPLISVVGSKPGSQFASASRSDAGSRSKSRSKSKCVSGKVEVKANSVVGCVGNVLSFLVFTTTYLRRLSSSVYLAALAVVDTVFLLVLFCSSLTAVGIQVSRRATPCGFLVC